MQHPPTSEDARSAHPRPRLLVAEDDDDIRSVFELVLAESYEIRCTSTAAHALAVAASWTPDVVLLDWTLPDGSGDDVVRHLRAMRSDYRYLPIVLISGVPTVRALAAELGVVACPKPCDINQLVEAIELALSSARAE